MTAPAVCDGFAEAAAALARGDAAEAARRFAALLERAPGRPELLHGHGLALFALGRGREAAEHVGAAHLAAPEDDEILKNLSIMLLRLWRLERAREHLEELTRRRPEDPAAANLYGGVLGLMGRHAEGHPWLERAEAMDPGNPQRRPGLLQGRAALCVWSGHEEDRAALARRVSAELERGVDGGVSPFGAITLGLPEPIIRELARARARGLAPSARPRRPLPGPRAGGRIRVGYVSPDLHHHPVGLLMAPILEAHDPARFEVRAYALRTVKDETRARIEASVDAVVELDDEDESRIARRIETDELDLLIDLAGFTSGGCPGALARRPARVQAHFLGYPGTMTRALVDYQILHESRVGAGRASYDEALALLPETFIAAEGFAEPERIPTRAELGLPEEAFVFAFFGAAYRIEPRVFDAWMHIIEAIPGSVMWIQNGHPPAQDNLRREAAARGVDPDRLVFGAWGLLSQKWHHTRADLWLDGWHVSSGTASIVAAWTGTPLLTLAGATPQSRTGAGVLRGAGRPELVVESEEAYVDVALALARDPCRLAALRERMLAERSAVPLFRVERFTRHLEAAFEAMVARDRAGRAPSDLIVPGLDDAARRGA